ncbi:DoxX family membrane protein [Candidatus Uhrbacteria bacterium]|nr:DoxX family membrane protein [Candidatus Uhrbacteria bacterium]
MSHHSEISEPPISRFIFSHTGFAWFWLIIRVYVGWQWLVAGWGKVISPAWTGSGAGSVIRGFVSGALQKTGGAHPDVSGWYASFLSNVVSPQSQIFSFVVAYGELLVGLGLILGAFVGIAAFFGIFMNANYLFAGTISINPMLLLIQIFLVLAWRTAGWYGLDRFLLRWLGTPWKPGDVFRKKNIS